MIAGLLLISGVIIVLIAIPVTLKFDVGRHRSMQDALELRWLFGLVRIPISTQKGQRGRAASRRRKRQKPVSTSNNFPWRNLVLQKRFRQRMLRYVGEFWRSIYKENVRVGIRIGLDDPADTGLLWAIVGPVSAALGAVRQFTFSVEPDFVRPGFEFNASGLIRFSPLRILFITAALLLSPVVWEGVQQMRSAR